MLHVVKEGTGDNFRDYKTQRKKNFVNFFLHFSNLDKILNIFKKKQKKKTLYTSEVTDFEKSNQANVSNVPFQKTLRQVAE